MEFFILLLLGIGTLNALVFDIAEREINNAIEENDE